MPIEFTFMAGAGPDTFPAAHGVSFFFDPRRSADELTVVEEVGFRGVVIDDPAGPLTNFDLVAGAAASTSSLQLVLTHWAGVVAPTVAARQIAALDAACAGRLALRILAGGGAGPTRESHIELWQRTDEYLTLLKRLWSNERPFDHEGPFYSVREGFVADKGPRGLGIPVRMSGLSGTALQIAARHADVFELEPGRPQEVRVLMERVRAAAARFGRADRIRFALPVRYGGERPARLALPMLELARAGVSEFMIGGIDDPQAIRAFGTQMAALLRGEEGRPPAQGFAGVLAPQAGYHRQS